MDVRALDLYWIPLGAGTRVVRISGRLFEWLSAVPRGRRPARLFHTALVATVGESRVMIEMAPVPRQDRDRGVVATGAVGMRWLRTFRIFRYEIRCWRDGEIPDLARAVGSPVRITDDAIAVRDVLDLVRSVPSPVWGRDELHLGEMWNSNSVVAWLLAGIGGIGAAGEPPERGRAPGWDAGIVAATRYPVQLTRYDQR